MTSSSTFRPPRTRRGTPRGATPLAILGYLLAGRTQEDLGDRCRLCGRQRGTPRVIAPASPSLAALVPGAGTWRVVLCRRCSTAPAVAVLLAAD